MANARVVEGFHQYASDEALTRLVSAILVSITKQEGKHASGAGIAELDCGCWSIDVDQSGLVIMMIEIQNMEPAVLGKHSSRISKRPTDSPVHGMALSLLMASARHAQVSLEHFATLVHIMEGARETPADRVVLALLESACYAVCLGRSWLAFRGLRLPLFSDIDEDVVVMLRSHRHLCLLCGATMPLP